LNVMGGSIFRMPMDACGSNRSGKDAVTTLTAG
jgi:hypothetical protein